MPLQLTVCPLTADGEPDIEAGEAHSFAEDASVLVGSSSACNLHLPEQPEICFSLARGADGQYRLEARNKGLDIQVNDTVVAEDRQIVRNGDFIRLPGLAVHLLLRFKRVSISRRSSVLQSVTVALILLILVGELAVMLRLSALVERERLWTAEIARQRTLQLVDDLRYRINRATVRGSPNADTVDLVGHQVDEISAYLREHADQLSQEEMTTIYQDLTYYQQQLRMAYRDQLYPPPAEIDAAATLNPMIEDSQEP